MVNGALTDPKWDSTFHGPATGLTRLRKYGS